MILSDLGYRPCGFLIACRCETCNEVEITGIEGTALKGQALNGQGIERTDGVTTIPSRSPQPFQLISRPVSSDDVGQTK
jgi:hypothetical protein